MPVLVLRPVVYTSPVVADNTALKDHPQQVGACGLGCCFLRSSNIRARLRRARYLLCNRVATVDTKHRWIRKQHATHQNTTSDTFTQKETQSTRNNKQSNKEQRTQHEIHPPHHVPKCRIFNSFANCFCFSMSSNLWCSRPMQCSNTCGTTTFMATDVATSILSCHRATYSM